MPEMTEYKVTVEKTQYQSGIVKVHALTPDDAQAKVDELIEAGKLDEKDIEWNDGASDDESGIRTTGDID